MDTSMEVKGTSMNEMTDIEFVDAIKARLLDKGWQTGRIGLSEGPNCLLGAAGHVGHDLVVDDEGVRILVVDGKELSEDDREYEGVPAMVRLTQILGEERPMTIATLNDCKDTLEELFAEVDKRMEAKVNV